MLKVVPAPISVPMPHSFLLPCFFKLNKPLPGKVGGRTLKAMLDLVSLRRSHSFLRDGRSEQRHSFYRSGHADGKHPDNHHGQDSDFTRAISSLFSLRWVCTHVSGGYSSFRRCAIAICSGDEVGAKRGVIAYSRRPFLCQRSISSLLWY